MKNKTLVIIILVLWSVVSTAQVHITIDNPQTWSIEALKPYIGQNVVFDQPMYVVNNYSSLEIAPKRVFAANDLANPSDANYNTVVRNCSLGVLKLMGVYDGYHRCGEKIYDLHAYVRNENELTLISGEWSGNTREDLERSLPNLDLRTDLNGDTLRHTLTVCAMNLEYYLTEQFGNDRGPRDYDEHQKQRKKTSKALARICADIYGLVEIQQGNGALKELADDLTKNTGRTYQYINSGTSASGTYTQSGYVYCSDEVEPVAAMQSINKGVANRKKMQVFREKATGETFIFSLNHFKAKSGTGTGEDADNGQGSFNHTRVLEAQAVLSKYNSFRTQAKDSDVLFMGDLNAYAKEDPVLEFTRKGHIDLHNYFYGDTSYSYVFRSTAGTLDHALCSTSMLPQVTGMAAYHINSDEKDYYTYDSSNDTTMFRSSDHDPILVGLLLGRHTTAIGGPTINTKDIYFNGHDIVIEGALSPDSRSYYAIYTIDGRQAGMQRIESNYCTIARPDTPGIYVLNIYANGTVAQYKLIINN